MVTGIIAAQMRMRELQQLLGLAPMLRRDLAGFTTTLHEVTRSGFAGWRVGTRPGFDLRAATIAIAHDYLGVPYVYGGTDPATGLDCSGFVQLVFRRVGIDLPRTTYDQVQMGQPVHSLAEARPGDLVFSVGDGNRVHGHVGIYLGGRRWIAAPYTGEVVKIEDVPTDITAIRRLLP
jgi:cell wall-associated NlpC family hydrolase